MKRWAQIAITLIFFCHPSLGFSEAYPSKPIRFIVGFAAGNSADVVSRLVIGDIRDRTGAVIVVENRPGALGAIGIRAVMAAPSDGYTLLTSASASHSSGPNVLRALEQLKPLENLTHVARVARFDIAVVVNAKSPWVAVQDVVSASARQNRINYGFGTSTFQVAATGFALAAGIKAASVPYQAPTAALNDLLAGRLDFVASDLGTILGFVQSGALRPLVLLAERRSALLPEVPTARELGLGNLFLSGWVGIGGPKGMPDEAVKWWTEQVRISLAKPQLQQKILSVSAMETTPLFGSDFNAFLEDEQRRWAEYAAKAGVRAE